MIAFLEELFDWLVLAAFGVVQIFITTLRA